MQQAPQLQCQSKNNPSPSSKSTATPEELTLYPAYTFKASATWFKWVKLTAHDIHSALKPHQKYAADITTALAVPPDRRPYGGRGRDDNPLLLFYLNHPIQFVQVIGVVVALDEYFEKFWLFTVDDGSGATIDVTCQKPEKEKEKVNGSKLFNNSIPQKGGGRSLFNNSNPQREGNDHTTLKLAGNKEIGGHNMTKSRLSSSSTAQAQPQVNNGNGTSEPTEEQLLHATMSTLRIGMVVQAKGTIATFRSTRQLTLLRLTIVPNTAHEMALISSRTSFLKSTLSTPWILSSEAQKRLALEAQDDRHQEHRRAVKKRERLAKLQERELRHAKLIRAQYEAEEKQRLKAADAAQRAGHALQEGASKP